jgi:uncharacterized repeat protein (TIGR01451 family)
MNMSNYQGRNPSEQRGGPWLTLLEVLLCLFQTLYIVISKTHHASARLLLLGVCTALTPAVLAQTVSVNFGMQKSVLGSPIACDGTFYQTRSSNTATTLMRFPAIGPGSASATSVWTSNAAVGLNGLFFNPIDNYLYAFRTSTNTLEVYRLGDTGANLAGTVVGGSGAYTLTSSFIITAATADAQGRMYFVGQAGGNISPSAIYRVDSLADSNPGAAGVQIAVAQVYPLNTTTPNVGDFAFGPDGNLYAATGTSVYQFVLSGGAATVNARTISTVGGIGSAFFDSSNRFYVYENATSNLYQVSFAFGSAFATDAVTSLTADTIPYSPPPALPSPVTASDGASCTPPVVTVSGQVWQDPNGSVTLDGSETGTNAGSTTLSVYAVDATGNVVAKAAVAANGSYTLVGVPANVTVTSRLSNVSGVLVGAPAPAVGLPAGYTSTGENKNGITETTTPGEIALTTTTANVSGQNFGIERLPDTTALTSAGLANSSGDTSLAATPLAGTDPDGTVASFKIVTLPTAAQGVLRWDDDNNATTPPVAVTVNQFIPVGSADKLFFDPAPTFTGNATFTYAAVDNAGKEDPSAASYTIPVLPADIDLVITKTSSLSGPQVGDTVIYTVTVENLSPTNATGVIVTDTFPASLTFVETLGCAEDPNVLTGPSVTCSLGTISAGATKSFTVEGVVIDQGVLGDDSDDVGSVISNSVSVTANETDSDTSNNTDTIDITVSKLQLYKEVRNVTAGGAFTTSVSGKPGDTLEYRVTYTRTGPPIFDVSLEDVLDSNVTLAQNAYGLPSDKEILLRCPDNTDVLLETGAVTTLSIDLVAVCSLSTAPDAAAVVREALLGGETGYFLFRAIIR